MRFLPLFVLCIITPVLSYADDVQFHMITELGNTFPLLPPDRPKPANIIGETPHLAIQNPPNGILILTAQNHTTQLVSPIQVGVETAGFGNGVVRVIYGSTWDAGTDYTFRDQPFGTLTSDTNKTMYHPQSMPLYTDWAGLYTKYNTTQVSGFGLKQTTPSIPQGGNGEYTVSMGSRDRVGLDFGVPTDAVFYIYRGCTTCKSDVVVGLGDPNNVQSSLPNNSTDHPRGWKDAVTSCDIVESKRWSGRGTSTISGIYTIPAPEHSKAGEHYTPNRYDDLSILPQSHSLCTGNLYTKDNKDNRKHDICVSLPITATAFTTYTYSCTQTETTTHYVNGTVSGTTQSTSSCSSVQYKTNGTCSTGTGTTTPTTQGYKFTVTCTGGAIPTPPPSTTTTHGGGNVTITKTYSAPTYSTDGLAKTDCQLNTNTPHLNLESVLTLTPGVNIYRPGTIPAGHHLIILLDDTEDGGGSTERIQVFGSGSYNITGPYNFHLRAPVSGVLYDSHAHYGWVERNHTYDTVGLAEMSYYAPNTMDGYNDGYGSSVVGTRLCHGSCFLGPAGIDGDEPRLRSITPDSRYMIPAGGGGAIYDHINHRWLGSYTDRITAASLYMSIPFVVDTGVNHIRLYGDTFDPQNQNPSYREDPDMLAGLPCHLEQRVYYTPYANNMTINAGDVMQIPILPDKRYIAFMGNGECYWYDISTLPSPLSGISAGARTIPLYNGTILAGDLTSTTTGTVHVDIILDADFTWQSEAYGIHDGTGAANVTWAVPPLHVNMTATARVNGAGGACGSIGVYCSSHIIHNGTTISQGAYIHGPHSIHDTPYGMAPPGYNTGVYGIQAGRCSGLINISEGTDGIITKSIPKIPVTAGDTITLGFEVVVITPGNIPHKVQIANMPGHLCDIQHTKETATMHVRTMTATLR